MLYLSNSLNLRILHEMLSQLKEAGCILVANLVDTIDVHRDTKCQINTLRTAYIFSGLEHIFQLICFNGKKQHQHWVYVEEKAADHNKHNLALILV